MTRTEWHWFLGIGIVAVNITCGFIAYRLWRWKHPLVVHMPAPSLPDEFGRAISEIVDSNHATRSHVSSVVDGMRGDTESTKVEVGRLARIIRRIAKQFGVNVDDIDP